MTDPNAINRLITATPTSPPHSTSSLRVRSVSEKSGSTHSPFLPRTRRDAERSGVGRLLVARLLGLKERYWNLPNPVNCGLLAFTSPPASIPLQLPHNKAFSPHRKKASTSNSPGLSPGYSAPEEPNRGNWNGGPGLERVPFLGPSLSHCDSGQTNGNRHDRDIKGRGAG